MTDSLSADLSALMRRLDEPASDAGVKSRLIVATDWSKGAMPLTALRAFRTLVPSSAPIELVFAVPHEPTEADAACVHVLVDELGDPGQIGNLELESFAAVLAQPYDSAIVPVADPEENLVQLGGFILRMRDLMRTYEAARGGGMSATASVANSGQAEALKRRLDEFVS